MAPRRPTTTPFLLQPVPISCSSFPLLSTEVDKLHAQVLETAFLFLKVTQIPHQREVSCSQLADAQVKTFLFIETFGALYHRTQLHLPTQAPKFFYFCSSLSDCSGYQHRVGLTCSALGL